MRKDRQITKSMNNKAICFIVMSAIRKIKQCNDQRVVVVMEGAILAWRSR